MPDESGLATTTIFKTKLGEVEHKIPNAGGLVKKADYAHKMSDIDENILLLLIIINLQKKYLMKR